MSYMDDLITPNPKASILWPPLAMLQVLLVLIFVLTFELAYVAEPYFDLYRWLGLHV